MSDDSKLARELADRLEAIIASYAGTQWPSVAVDRVHITEIIRLLRAWPDTYQRGFDAGYSQDDLAREIDAQLTDFKEWNGCYPGNIDMEYLLRHGMNCLQRARDRIVEQDNLTERSFQVLEMYGVPRGRARYVANGIEVLVTRWGKEIAALRAPAPALCAGRMLVGNRLLACSYPNEHGGPCYYGLEHREREQR